MENLLRVLWVLAASFALTIAAPIGDAQKRDKYVQSLEELREPLSNLRMKTQNIEELYQKTKQKINPDFWNSDDYSADMQFKDICKTEFSQPLHDKSFISAMKIFQDLVRVTQDLQMSESGINKGDETQFVTDFRQLEYDMRNLVEDKMRREAFAILDDKYQKEVPPYSVGGYSYQKEIDNDRVVGKNLVKLRRIRHCLHQFILHTIDEVAGKRKTT